MKSKTMIISRTKNKTTVISRTWSKTLIKRRTRSKTRTVSDLGEKLVLGEGLGVRLGSLVGL